MSCTNTHNFCQIDTRKSPSQSGIITQQCKKCGIIDNTISHDTYIHMHSRDYMNFVGQVMGQYVLKCKHINCNYQIRIQKPFQQE